MAGVATIVLIFGAAFAAPGQEPSFKATAAEILSYLRLLNSPWGEFRSFVFTLGLMAFLWFVVGLTTLLRRAEGEPPWRSTIAVASGVLLVPIVYSWNGDAAAFRADDLEPQIARFAFDAGNVGFANAWVALGSFAICCGWVIASTRFLPRWLGWLALASGVGLILSRAVWTNYIWLLPYLLFWLWVLAVAVLLTRRPHSTDVIGDPHRDHDSDAHVTSP